MLRAQSRGADPSIRTEDYDPYLNPGRHLPIDIAPEDETVRAKLLALDKKYADTPKARPGTLIDMLLVWQSPAVGPALSPRLHRS